VEIIVDNWNPRGRGNTGLRHSAMDRYRCKLYKAGPNRKVQGRKGMVYVEEDWVDQMMI
jgi:hypothetical protein